LGTGCSTPRTEKNHDINTSHIALDTRFHRRINLAASLARGFKASRKGFISSSHRGTSRPGPGAWICSISAGISRNQPSLTQRLRKAFKYPSSKLTVCGETSLNRPVLKSCIFAGVMSSAVFTPLIRRRTLFKTRRDTSICSFDLLLPSSQARYCGTRSVIKGERKNRSLPCSSWCISQRSYSCGLTFEVCFVVPLYRRLLKQKS